MPYKASKEMEDRIAKVAEWLGMSYVDTYRALLEIGLSGIEKQMSKQLPEKQQTIEKSASE